MKSELGINLINARLNIRGTICHDHYNRLTNRSEVIEGALVELNSRSEETLEEQKRKNEETKEALTVLKPSVW